MASALFLMVSADPVHAQTAPYVRTNYGTIGMIEMPSARMAPDGELSLGASFSRNIQRYNLGFQVTPWLEGSFRYSGLQNFDSDYPVYYDRSFAMKLRLWEETSTLPAVALGVNDLVGTGIYSGEYLVASKRIGSVDVSLGMGWGRIGSAGTFQNPVAELIPPFRNRPFLADAGSAKLNTFFRGPHAGVFGGVVWSTPLSGVDLAAEFSSDAYTYEASRNTFVPKNQFNIGATYHITSDFSVGLSWLYGTSIGLNVSLNVNPVHPQYAARLEAPMTEVTPRTAAQRTHAVATLVRNRRDTSTRQSRTHVREFGDFVMIDLGAHDVGIQGDTMSVMVTEARDPAALCLRTAAGAKEHDLAIHKIRIVTGARTLAACQAEAVLRPALIRTEGAVASGQAQPANLVIDATGAEPSGAPAETVIIAEAGRQKIAINAIRVGQNEATIYYRNAHYFAEKDAIERLARILMQHLPPDIEKFHLIAVGSVPEQKFNVLRAPAERNLVNEESATFEGNSTEVMPALMRNPVLSNADEADYPRFNWSFFPQFRQQLFDPSNPFAVQFLAGLGASVELFRGLSIGGSVETNLYDNFNVNRPSDSLLPHVRSDFVRYFTDGKNGIASLATDYRFRLSPEVNGIIKAGYLESMFAGVGGEILWRPTHQRWALGVDLYGVRQRNYDRLFGLQPYKVVTGHVSAYYSSPFYDIDIAVRAGRYLAGDYGATLEVTRRFATGVEIGAFATVTNVSARQFGEGSFDKGIMIRIPLGWMLPIDSQSQFGMDLRPVQRDGGQRLIGDTTLFYETRRTSYGEILRTQDRN
jgi:hypothetical protein